MSELDAWSQDFLTNFQEKFLPAMEAAIAKHPEVKLDIVKQTVDGWGKPLSGYHALYWRGGETNCHEFWKTYDKERRERGLWYTAERR